MARKFPTSNPSPNFEPDAGGELDNEARFGIDPLYDSAVDFSVPNGEDERAAPSLPIILLSAASGVSAGIIALYITYNLLGLALQWSMALAILCTSAALGSTGALLSSLTGSRASTSNIAFSCGLIVVTLLFFALCTFVGAMAATFILTL